MLIRRRTFVALGTGALAGALVGALVGCSAGKPELVPSDEGVEPSVTVRVIDNEYVPAEVDVKPGEAVQWVFEGVSAKHDVVADDGSFVSELVSSGTYTHVFTEAGEFAYICSIHPEMTGVVNVK